METRSIATSQVYRRKDNAKDFRMNYQQTTVHLGNGLLFDVYRTGLFVITRPHGESHENIHGIRVRRRDVLARGRMRNGDTVVVTRGGLSTVKVRDMLHGAGYPLKVVRGDRR